MIRWFIITVLILVNINLPTSSQTNQKDYSGSISFEILPVTIKEINGLYKINSILPIEKFISADSALIFPEGMYFSFRLINNSEKRLFYLIYDVISQESCTPLKTSYSGWQESCIYPGDTIILNTIYYFTKPYGCEMFGLLYSEDYISDNPDYSGNYFIDVIGNCFESLPMRNYSLNNKILGIDSVSFGIETICVTVDDGDQINRCMEGVKYNTRSTILHELGSNEFRRELNIDLKNRIMNRLIDSHTSIMRSRGNVDRQGEIMVNRLLKFFIEEIYSRGFRSIPESQRVINYYYQNDSLYYAIINNRGIIGSGKSGATANQLDKYLQAIQRSIYYQQDKKRLPEKKRNIGTLTFLEDDDGIDYDSAIVALSQFLIPDSLIADMSNIEHINILPERNLGTVPFCLLKPFDSHAYFIDSVSLSISSSFFDLFSFTHPDWKYGFSRALLVGNPDYPKSRDWVFPQLPEAENEVIEISEILNTTAIVGSDATLSKVIQYSGDADLLYFATHGIADSNNALENSFIIFSASEDNNGRWYAVDIMQSDLNAKLAVLSACQTGLGQTHEGGIIGLSRAFQEAGVPRVIMSLWSIGDESTYEFMMIFLNKLQTYLPSRALQQAMLEYKKKNPDPFNWGAFTLFGYPY